MLIYYADAAGYPDADASSPSDVDLPTALSILGKLDPKTGFLGVELQPPYCLQLLPVAGNRARLELLDTSRASWDAAEVDLSLVRELIQAVAEGRDALALARTRVTSWEKWPG